MDKDELNNIDFVEIFIKTKKFFNSYYKLIATVTLIGVITSVSNYYISDNYYNTEFVITDGSKVEGKIIKDIINHSEEGYISNDNLKLNEDEINTAKQDFLNIKKIFVNTAMQNGLHFKLTIYDNEADLKSLKNSIISLLSNNIYLTEYSRTKKNQLELELKSTKQEIQLIDSLQKIMLLNSGTLTINSTDFSKNLIDLKNHQLKLKEKLNELGNYSTIRDIYKPDKPIRTLSSAVLFGLILGFFLSIVLGVLHQLNQLSKQRE